MNFPHVYSIHGCKFLIPVYYTEPLALFYFLTIRGVSEKKAKKFVKVMGSEYN